MMHLRSLPSYWLLTFFLKCLLVGSTRPKNIEILQQHSSSTVKTSECLICSAFDNDCSHNFMDHLIGGFLLKLTKMEDATRCFFEIMKNNFVAVNQYKKRILQFLEVDINLITNDWNIEVGTSELLMFLKQLLTPYLKNVHEHEEIKEFFQNLILATESINSNMFKSIIKLNIEEIFNIKLPPYQTSSSLLGLGIDKRDQDEFNVKEKKMFDEIHRSKELYFVQSIHFQSKKRPRSINSDETNKSVNTKALSCTTDDIISMQASIAKPKNLKSNQINRQTNNNKTSHARKNSDETNDQVVKYNEIIELRPLKASGNIFFPITIWKPDAKSDSAIKSFQCVFSQYWPLQSEKNLRKSISEQRSAIDKMNFKNPTDDVKESRKKSIIAGKENVDFRVATRSRDILPVAATPNKLSSIKKRKNDLKDNFNEENNYIHLDDVPETQHVYQIYLDNTQLHNKKFTPLINSDDDYSTVAEAGSQYAKSRNIEDDSTNFDPQRGEFETDGHDFKFYFLNQAFHL